jgi:hypothetical protein
MGAEAVDRAVLKLPRHHAAACALVVNDQIDREIFDEELDVVAETLLIERVDDRVAGPVGGGAGAPSRITIAVIGHMAAKRPLINPPILGP